MHTSQIIYVFFNIINDGLQYDSEANTPFSPEKLLQMAYHAIRSSVIYTIVCKEYNRKQKADKTWANFKTFFALEYNKLCE